MIDSGTVCQAIVFIIVIVGLAIVLQRLFNPHKNSITRKYLELENEVPPQEKDEEKEKEFYEQIWNAKDSERKGPDERS